MELSQIEKSRLVKGVLLLLVLASIYFAVLVVTEVRSFRFIGGGAPASNTISFNGTGEIFAAPDIATISFTIREEAKEMKDAQDKVATKETAVLEFLQENEIAEKDIKTENYSSYPKYDYSYRYPCLVYPCPTQTKVIGYEVSEYVSVKVRDIAQAGEIVDGIGAAGVTEISGPNFSIEKEEELKAQARQQAIEEAKAKAKTLSKDLGVRLVRIVSFSEDGNYPFYSMYDKGAAVMESSSRAPAPTLPTGENKITSNVTITYEIR
jgi:hypothetical protein